MLDGTSWPGMMPAGGAHLGVIIPQLRDQAPGHALVPLERRPRVGHVAAARRNARRQAGGQAGDAACTTRPRAVPA